jgi:hypothetical protein
VLEVVDLLVVAATAAMKLKDAGIAVVIELVFE